LIARVVKVHALNHMHVVTCNNYYARKKGRTSATSPELPSVHIPVTQPHKPAATHGTGLLSS